MDKLLKVVKDGIVPLVTVFTGAMVVYLNHAVTESKNEFEEARIEIERIRTQLDQSREAREELAQQQEFVMTVYEKVIGSLESRDERQQAVATQLVVVMLEDPLRTALLNALKGEGTSDTRARVDVILSDERQFKAENEIVTDVRDSLPRDEPWKQYAYDFFWCSPGTQAKGIADRMKTSVQSAGATGRVRVRELPESINASPGYNVAGYEIRPNSGEEMVANRLKALGDSLLAGNREFRIRYSKSPTPGYVSVFVCPRPSA